MPKASDGDPPAGFSPPKCAALPAEHLETRLLYCRAMLLTHGWMTDGDKEKSQRRYLKKKEDGDYASQ